MNWFRKGADGKFLWPGYGENSRVLKWVFERVTGTAEAVETPIGRLPAPGALDLAGLNVPPAALEQVLQGGRRRLARASCPRFARTTRSSATELPQGLREELSAAREAAAGRGREGLKRAT